MCTRAPRRQLVCRNFRTRATMSALTLSGTDAATHPVSSQKHKRQGAHAHLPYGLISATSSSTVIRFKPFVLMISARRGRVTPSASARRARRLRARARAAPRAPLQCDFRSSNHPLSASFVRRISFSLARTRVRPRSGATATPPAHRSRSPDSSSRLFIDARISSSRFLLSAMDLHAAHNGLCGAHTPLVSPATHSSDMMANSRIHM